MTTPTLRSRKPGRRPLHESKRRELLFGPDGVTVFQDDADREAMWREHRDLIIDERGPGHRPAAWWAFDAPEPRNPREPEPAQLLRLGVLSADEREAVGAEWLRSERIARQRAQASPAGRVSRAVRIQLYQSIRASLAVPEDLPGDVDDPLIETNEIRRVVTAERDTMPPTPHIHKHTHDETQEDHAAGRRSLVAARQAEERALSLALPDLIAARDAARTAYYEAKAAADAAGVKWNEAISAAGTSVKRAGHVIDDINIELKRTASPMIGGAVRWVEHHYQRTRGPQRAEYEDVGAVLAALQAARVTLEAWELDEFGDDLAQKIDELKRATGVREAQR